MDYRKSLSIYNYKQIILSYLTENRIVLIHGGVASGKSTQVRSLSIGKVIVDYADSALFFRYRNI